MKSSGYEPRQQDDRTALLIRLPVPLKNRLTAYARRRGLSGNAAHIILLESALDQAEADT